MKKFEGLQMKKKVVSLKRERVTWVSQILLAKNHLRRRKR